LPPAELPAAVPTLEEWAETEGLGDWSTDELLAIYEEKFGAASNSPSQRRRSARNERLRTQRLKLLQELEEQAAEQPMPTDQLAGWLAPALAGELLERGISNLGELQALIARGGRWWAGLRSYGPVKAARLQRQVEQLLGALPARSWSLQLSVEDATGLSGARGVNRAVPGSASIAATDDRAAVQAWIVARAGSALTAKAYEREADRFILWCVLERRKALSSAVAEDCRAYMDFLADVPASWISRRHVPRLAPGWAPFAGPLSVASQRQAIGIVHSMFEWLVQAGYLRANPWALVRRRIGDDAESPTLAESSRAFTPAVWAALKAQADDPKEDPATAARMRFLLVFGEATGLRPAELVNARRGHFSRRNGGWWLRVHGKGARNRVVPVPSTALQATVDFLAHRGVDFTTAADDLPLLALLADANTPMSYPALHKAFKRFVRRALMRVELPASDRGDAEAAATHWLRHTHATRAAEQGVAADVLQANLGHADPRTTAGYYKTQLDRRAAELERVYGLPAQSA
jgi:integrase